MNQGKSKVSYGKELYEIVIINGFNFFSIIFGNNTRYYVSEQCLHIITTKKNERPEFCSKCGIGLDWTAFSTHKECPQCQRKYSLFDQICESCGTKLVEGFNKI